MGWLLDAARWLDRKVFSRIASTRQAKLVQGLEIIKAVLHKQLAAHYRSSLPGREDGFADQAAAAVLNRIFGYRRRTAEAERFAGENASLVGKLLGSLAAELPLLKNEITRALYVKVIIDDQAGHDSRSLLARATDLGLFDPQADIPLPEDYLRHAVKLAGEHGLGPPG